MVRNRWMLFAACLAIFALALPLSAGDEWKPIFNGKDMSGWEHIGSGPFGLKPKKVKQTLKELLPAPESQPNVESEPAREASS